MMSNHHELKITRARELRKAMTDTERFVWAKLRSRRFAGYKFRRQKPIGSYIVDFVCAEYQLIIELDGGQHVERTAYDNHRTEQLERLGYRVLRFWNHIVLTDWDMVEEVIWQSLQQSPSVFVKGMKCGPVSDPLTPNPSPQRGEGDQPQRKTQ
ncbi:MAG: endonuclease domain-containing protein [Gemmatales bacterium]